MDGIEALVAESAVRRLIAQVALTGDVGAPEDYRQVYSDDAVWQWGSTVDAGIDAIVASARTRREQGVSGPGSGSKHVVQVMSIELLDAANARAVSYFTFYTQITGEVRVGPVGTYRDALAVVDGDWKITKRVGSTE
jgi:HIP---CoA ligase